MHALRWTLQHLRVLWAPTRGQCSRARPRQWTAAEDARLLAAVSAALARDRGAIAWGDVAKAVPQRTSRGCRLRWTESLDARRRTGRWAPEEIRALAALAPQHAPHYARIARLMPTRRTPAQVRERIVEAGRPSRPWTPADDQALRDAVQRHGRRWVAVAREVKGRTDAQCLERFSMSADPRLRKGKWSKEEDRVLQRVVCALQAQKRPFDFGEVSEMMRGMRSRKACRARWEVLQRRKKAEEGE